LRARRRSGSRGNPWQLRRDPAPYGGANTNTAELRTGGKVSTSLLLDAQIALQPRCVIFHRRPDGNAGGVSLNGMVYILWVPTRKQLTAAGLAVDGYWPRSRREMARMAARIIQPAGREQLIRFGNEDHRRRQRGGKYAYEDLRNCALEQEAAVDPAAAPVTPSD
jgi:hypothetical protein